MARRAWASQSDAHARSYRRWLDPRPHRDPRRCPVCGHRTLPPVNRSVQWILVALLGAALCYIALDVAQDGRLDGSLWRAVTTPRSGATHR